MKKTEFTPNGTKLTPGKLRINPANRSPNKASPDASKSHGGNFYNDDPDFSKWSNIGPKEVSQLHARSDVDKNDLSQHHTLGPKRGQASPGDHTHDGISSKEIMQTGQEIVSFTSLSSTSISVTFPVPYPAGVTPKVLTNIASGAGATARWGSRAITIDNLGFILFLFKGDSADAAATFVSVPVQWMAVL